MNWPLVSRRAFEMALDERDRLREQVDALIDSLTRIQRAQAGLTELPAQPRKRIEPIPPDIADHIRETWDGKTRGIMKDEVRKRYAQTRDWDAVRRELEMEPEEAPAP